MSIIVVAIPVVTPDEEAAFGFSWTDLQSSNPGADFMRFLYRALGHAWHGFALFTVAVVLKSYRKGKQWASYVLWALPLVLGLFAGTAYVAGVVALALTYATFTVIAVLGPLTPYRKFFPRERSAAPRRSAS